MFYCPMFVQCPQYYYYQCLPTSEPTLSEIPVQREDFSLDRKEAQNSENFPNEDEKIILNREDLEKEGYEQTKKPWTKKQDRLLLKLCSNQNARFEEIASQIEGRNAKMCYSRFRRLTYQTRVGWAKEEDQLLLALVEQHGDSQWKALAPMFKGRTHKQLKDHYMNYLKPDLLKCEWTLEEDLQLIRLINLHGKNWKMIQGSLEGRSRNQIKNRYFGRIVRLNKKKLQLNN